MSLELLRVEFAVFALVRNDDGDVLDEVQIAQGRAFPRQLDNLPADLRKAFAEAETHHTENGQKP